MKQRRASFTGRLAIAVLVCGVLSVVPHVGAADIVLDDFSGGVTAVNGPNGSGLPGVWYDAANNTFGTPSASTLGGSPAMRIDDGGFTNGVYIIYDGVVPADGDYQVSIDLAVDESGSPTGFSAYQLGVAVGANAQHRAPDPSALPGVSIVGDFIGLTTGNDTGLGVQTVTTPTFTASAGDSVLIALGTDVQTGAWNANSSLWSGNFVLADNITLVDLNAPAPGDVFVVDDFAGGVVHVNSPGTTGQFEVWYDATSNTFGTPSASTLEGSPSMRIDDGGFTNGVYAIYEAAIPETGEYQLEVDIDIVETATGLNGIRAYQIGAAVGADALHRATALPGLPISGNYVGLTTGDDTVLATQKVVTASFLANAGDNLLIAFGTDVTSGGWNANSGTWSGSFANVDNILLRQLSTDPGPFELIVDNDDGSPAFVTTGPWTTSGTPGFEGGTDIFTSTGNASTAIWTADIPEAGFYEISAYYRAGANRASSAVYEISAKDGIETAVIDQTLNDRTFRKLGLFELEAGPVTVTLDAQASTPLGRVVLADAIKFEESAGPPPIDPAEMRIATIVVFDTINSTQAIQDLVDRIADQHFNAIAVHARYRGDATYFPNKADSTFTNVEPRNPAAGSIDVIEEFVTRGHRAGLKVFAYVNTHLVTDGANTDPRPDHVINRHPDWITYAYNGGSPVVMNTSFDSEGIWLEPALPEVRLDIANICGDIVSNYDVDGIVLDRIRYPQTNFTRTTKDFGYHPRAIDLFNAEYGKSGLPNPSDPDWIAFRQDNITRTVQQVFDTITAVDPDTLLMAFPIGRFGDAVNFNYQDWPAWMENQVVDAVLPQIFTGNNSTFITSATQQFAAAPADRLIGVSIDVFNLGRDPLGQIEIARQIGFQGSHPFRFTLIDPNGYADDIEEAYFGIAPFPDTPWKQEAVVCLGLDVLGTDGDDFLLGTQCNELIVGGAGADEIHAMPGDDMIVPDPDDTEGGADDIVDGGDGTDTVDYSVATASIHVDLTEGFAEMKPQVPTGKSIGEDTLSNIENIIAPAVGGHILIGNAADNVILGAGTDPGSSTALFGSYIEGRDGDDTLEAGGPDAGGLLTVILGGAGNDVIRGTSDGDVLLDGGEGNDEIHGYGGSDIIVGGPGDDDLHAGDGHFDWIEPGPGDDFVDGGEGDLDTVKYEGPRSNFTFCLDDAGNLIVTDTTGAEGTDTLTGVERLKFGGGAFANIWVRKLDLAPCNP